jgi:hypothetical protein
MMEARPVGTSVMAELVSTNGVITISPMPSVDVTVQGADKIYTFAGHR